MTILLISNWYGYNEGSFSNKINHCKYSDQLLCNHCNVMTKVMTKVTYKLHTAFSLVIQLLVANEYLCIQLFYYFVTLVDSSASHS